MKGNYYLALIGCVAGLSLGQLLFKLAAASHVTRHADNRWLMLVVNPWLIAGGALYAGLTMLWVWLLGRVPLSIAFPFYALAFVFTPLLAYAVLGETVNRSYVAGVVLILAGLVLTTR